MILWGSYKVKLQLTKHVVKMKKLQNTMLRKIEMQEKEIARLKTVILNQQQFMESSQRTQMYLQLQ